MSTNKVQDINEIKQSIASSEYYFVLRGKRITQKEPYKPYIEASKKIDITKQLHQLFVHWSFNISDDLCPFCGRTPTTTQEINRKTDNIKLIFHLCDTCRI